MEYQLVASCAFGLEALVKQEISDLGYAVQQVQDGKVYFTGPQKAICESNLWLRTADRIGIVLAEFPAQTFDELFDQTQLLPWSDWLPKDAFIHVTARSQKSKLFSLRDCQKIVKKAILESLKRKYKLQRFPEDGPRFPVEIALHRDQARLIMDTTGPSLHKRGYRSDAGKAPLKETLAAALVKLSRWEPPRLLVDPLCGSGTILIEAALLAMNRAPGLERQFQAEAWPWLSDKLWQTARAEARSQIQPLEVRLLGSDTDGKVLKKARENAENAGVGDEVAFQTLPVAEFRSRKRYGCWISNPPYGERLSDLNQINQLYREFRVVWDSLEDWSFFLLSSDPMLEKKLGRQASKRRKLFNGQIACQYYQFFGPFPPRQYETQRFNSIYN